MDFKTFNNEEKDKWGNTAEYKDYEQKSKNRSNKDSQDINEKFMSIFAELGSLKHLSIDDPKVQEKIKLLQSFITENYYNCTDEVFKELGQMYVNDERFKNNIDKVGGNGTAQFVSQSIKKYCSK